MPILLDNNVFRALTHRNSQGDRARLLRDIRAMEVAGSGRLFFALTPFSVLEAIGVVPPSPSLDFAPIPIEAGREAEAIEKMSDEILRQALEFYEQTPALSEANLLFKADEQRLHTRPDALPFFDRCITDVIKNREARCHMIACLAVDTLFKFDFPCRTLPFFQVRFLAMLFSVDEIDNSVSLFRVVKKIWDAVYSRMYRDPASFNRERLLKAQKHMEIKKSRDLVDCDLIHYLCVGFMTGDHRSPVIGCTTDDLDTIVTRIAVFKTIQEQYSKDALKMMGRKRNEVVRHEPGTVIHCTPNARVKGSIRVADIPVIG